MRQPDAEPLAQLLEAAMDQAGFSRRGLAVKLAGGTQDKNLIESYRRQVRRMLDGEQKTIRSATAARLSDALGVPYSYWPVEASTDRRGPIEIATEFVTRLSAGESVPREQLEQVSADLEETAAECLRLAAALRQVDEDVHSNS